MSDPKPYLLARLERVAEALGDDLEQVVFVGGMATLFHTASVRFTEDVDCIVDMAMPAYYRLGERMRARGFREDTSNIPCRWNLRPWRQGPRHPIVELCSHVERSLPRSSRARPSAGAAPGRGPVALRGGRGSR